MDNDYSSDVDEIIASLRTCDVAILKFISVGERLLVDFRHTPLDGPLVRVVPRVRSIGERYRMLETMRPRFPKPEIVAMEWPSFTCSLESSGALDIVRERISAAGCPQAQRDVSRAYRMLCGLERDWERKAITGAGFRTLWSATPAKR